ncbi:MAG: hypothetical protein WBO19_11590, partial [Terriglobia bacterium]
MENGIGKWKLETGGRVFQFLSSSFYFPISSFIECLTERRFLAMFFALIGVFCPRNVVRFEAQKTLT